MSEAEAMDRTADRHMTKLTRDEEKAILDMMNAPQLTVSGLIAELEKIEREHGGDLPVVMHDDSKVREVCAYDADGNINGQIVLTLGTENTDDYYPSFVCDWQPENLADNAKDA